MEPGSWTDYLKKNLSPFRYSHSLAVAACAKKLAPGAGADPAKAEAAGLVHDITKDKSEAQQLALFKKYGVALSRVERFSPQLWHAMTGALVLEREFAVSDAGLLHAVRYHTTGRAGMSPVERAVYLADFIAEGRDYVGVEALRRAASRSFNEGFLAALDFTFDELLKKGAAIHPDTVDARNDFICAQKEAALTGR